MAYEPMKSLRDFHDAFGQKRFIDADDAVERKRIMMMREKLIGEEYREVREEFDAYFEGRGDIYRFAKELADLLYVIYGTAEVLDIPLELVFEAVHGNNMTKLGPDGRPIVREDGKFLKPDTYVPLDVSRLW